MPTLRLYDTEKFPDLFAEKQVRVFQLPNFKVCIALYNGEYYAFSHLCPHQKHPLASANITAFGEVVCPLHEYRFSLSVGNEANNKCQALTRYKLHLNAEGVYLSF